MGGLFSFSLISTGTNNCNTSDNIAINDDDAHMRRGLAMDYYKNYKNYNGDESIKEIHVIWAAGGKDKKKKTRPVHVQTYSCLLYTSPSPRD